MKKYKVGDTIYTKGKVTEVDNTTLPYTVWFTSDNTIDELPATEPVKPVLPKEVADEISFAKSIKGVTFDDYIVRELIRSDYKDSATYQMIKSSDVPNVIEVLLNAWNNGYTVKKEPVSLVKVPGRLNRTTYYAIKDGGLAFGYLDKDKKQIRDYSAHKFTDAEITKFGLQDCEKEEVTDDDD